MSQDRFRAWRVVGTAGLFNHGDPQDILLEPESLLKTNEVVSVIERAALDELLGIAERMAGKINDKCECKYDYANPPFPKPEPRCKYCDNPEDVFEAFKQKLGRSE